MLEQFVLPDVLVLDPNYAKIAYLQTATQEELARTGLSERRLISAEWGVTGYFAKGTWDNCRRNAS